MSKQYPPDGPDNNNVVSMFPRQSRHLPEDVKGDPVETADGFLYLSMRYENSEEGGANSGKHEEELAIDVGLKKHYLFKFVEHHKDHSRVDTFDIPAEQLEVFIKTLDTRPGKLVEITQYIPDNMA